MSGLTSTGFVTKRLEDVRAELISAFRAVFGQGIKTGDDTQFGKLIGVMADREASIWEMAESVYNSQYPTSASDVSLDRIAEITAVTRNSAVRSTAQVYMAGVPGTVIPQGTLFSVVNTGDQFKTLYAHTLASSGYFVQVNSMTRSGSLVTASATAHGLGVGDRVFISGALQAEYNGLFRVTSITFPDTFRYEIVGAPVSPATGSIRGDVGTFAQCEAVLTGPISAVAGSLTQIVNTVSGLTRVENQIDAIIGRNVETDTELRARRIAALKGLGAARLEAIRGALLQITNVTEAKVFENATNLLDVATGRPPNSIECLVQGGADADILSVVWNKKAAGIEPYGSISGQVVDSQLISHTSKFSRPVIVPIYLILDITTTTDFPGAQTVIDRVITFESTLAIGDDVIVFPYLVSSFSDVPGITNVVVKIGIAPAPTLNANIIIGQTQLADFDTSRITVNVT